MKKTLLAAALFATGLCAPVSASTGDWGTISIITSMASYGVILFNHSGTRGAPPACGTTLNQRWAFTTSTPGGQAALSMLLYAYATHKRIFILGTGDCAAWGDTEGVAHFQIED